MSTLNTKLYRAWVPTVAGYLTFSSLGNVRIPGRVFGQDQKRTPQLDGTCYLSAYQIRNLSDGLKIGAWNADPKDGRHFYLLQAVIASPTSTEKTVKGYIFSAPSLHKDVLSSLYAADFDSVKTLAALNNLKAINSALPSHEQYATALTFTLHSDGCIEMIPECNTDTESELGRGLALEAYSFVRDLMHKHKFHSLSDDAVLWPIPCQSTDDLHWRDETMRNLHRSVITSFRNTSQINCLEALGKLSYLESFIAVSKNKLLSNSNEKINNLPSINTQALRCAIESARDHHVAERELKISSKNLSWAIFALLVPLLFVLVQLLQLPCIEGLSYEKDKCTKYMFSVPHTFMMFVQSLMFQIDKVAVLSVFFSLLIWAYLVRSRLVQTYKFLLDKQGLIGDFIDVILRLGISHRKSIIFVLTTCILAVLYSVWKLIY
jgi:hypothetical protein